MKKFAVSSVIFDLDGTLVDTAGDLHAATNHILQKYGRPTLPLEAVKADVGFGALRLIRKALDRTGGTNGVDLEEARQRFLEFYINNIAVHSALFPGGQQMLDALQANGITMGVCTNKPHKLALKLLEELNLLRYFSAVKGGDSYPFKKPDPRHLEETARAVGTGPYLMVGDASPDILAAKAAGVPVLAASFGYADVELSELKPDATIQSLAEVEALVAS